MSEEYLHLLYLYDLRSKLPKINPITEDINEKWQPLLDAVYKTG